MPQYKVRHQGQIKSVDYDGMNPTKAELRAALESKPTFDYPSSGLPKPPDPNQYYKKDWLEKLDPHARDYTRPDRNMFTVDLSKTTNKAVDRTALDTDNEAERKWKAQKLGFASGASESVLNMMGAPESVLGVAPKLFRQRYADYPGTSIKADLGPELTPVGGEQAYNSSFPKTIRPVDESPINYMERWQHARARMSPLEHAYSDQTGAIGPNIRKGHISGKFLKKDTPYEPDSFDSGKLDATPEELDYVKQMLDSLKLADEQKKLKGLGGRHLLKDETGAIGDVGKLKELKTAQREVKRAEKEFQIVANRMDRKPGDTALGHQFDRANSILSAARSRLKKLEGLSPQE